MSALPLLPFVRPRMASEYHAASATRALEPPGFLAMNYGYHTPLTTLIGQTVYGATLGGFFQLQQAMNEYDDDPPDGGVSQRTRRGNGRGV